MKSMTRFFYFYFEKKRMNKYEKFVLPFSPLHLTRSTQIYNVDYAS